MPIYWDALKTWKKDSNIFIETGTYHFEGSKKALEAGFKNIHTFEVVKENYDYCMNYLNNDTNIKKLSKGKKINIYLGDSVKLMPKVLSNITERCLFWLDSHFIADGSCDLHPILNELNIIKNHSIKKHTILIDDVRLFSDGKTPAMPISIQQVKDLILSINSSYKFTYEEGFTDVVNGINNDILVAYIED